jgi:alpha-L-rhamnosidase
MADFGVTLSGYIEVTLTAERGKEISFLYAEELDPEGRPQHNDMDKKHFYAESPFMCDKLIASGGKDHFKPHFTYHGFRYVLIEGAEAELLEICAHFIHQDVARISEFCSGNEVLNYIYNAGLRSTYSNMFWSLTDCPTREKLGWANDAQASVEQTLINFDIIPLYEKWFEDLKSSMCEDGNMPGIIPSPDWGFSHGPVCDCLLYELPYRIYIYTGNTKMLIDAIPYFERYIKFLEGRISSGEPFQLGDWMGANKGQLIPEKFISEFYLLKALKITAMAYEIANKGRVNSFS